MNYLIPHLNEGNVMINPTIRWTFAGFYTDRVDNLVIHVQFKTDIETFNESFIYSKEVVDRSDTGINRLMNLILTPYQVQ